MATLEQLRRIETIIKKHVGKENQISSGEIGPEIGIHEDATHVQVRNIIREAIERLNLPIGGGNKGYYLIKNEDELSQYQEGLIRRIDEMEKRKYLIEKAFKVYYEK